MGAVGILLGLKKVGGARFADPWGKRPVRTPWATLSRRSENRYGAGSRRSGKGGLRSVTGGQLAYNNGHGVRDSSSAVQQRGNSIFRSLGWAVPLAALMVLAASGAASALILDVSTIERAADHSKDVPPPAVGPVGPRTIQVPGFSNCEGADAARWICTDFWTRGNDRGMEMIASQFGVGALRLLPIPSDIDAQGSADAPAVWSAIGKGASGLTSDALLSLCARGETSAHGRVAQECVEPSLAGPAVAATEHEAMGRGDRSIPSNGAPPEGLLTEASAAATAAAMMPANNLLATEKSLADRGADLGPAADAMAAATIMAPPNLIIAAAALSLALLAALLYSRLRDDRVSEHRARDAILGRVRASSGMTCADLAAQLGLHYTTIQYHLRMLQRARLVKTRAHRGRTYYIGLEVQHASSVPGQSSAAKVLEVVGCEPGVTVARVAAALGLSPYTVHYQVRRLVQEGVIRKERDGRVLRLHAAATLSSASETS